MFLICTLTQSLFLGQKNSFVKNNIKIIRFSLFTLLFFNIYPFFLIQNRAFVNKLWHLKSVIPTILKTFQQDIYKLYIYLLYLPHNSNTNSGNYSRLSNIKICSKRRVTSCFFWAFFMPKI